MRGTIQSLGLLLWMTSFGCSTSVDVKSVEEETVNETLRLRLTATVSTDIALAGDILNYTVEVHRTTIWLKKTHMEHRIGYWKWFTHHQYNINVVAGEHTLSIRAVYTPTEDDFVADGDISGIVLEQAIPLEVSPLAIDFNLQIDKSVAQAERYSYRLGTGSVRNRVRTLRLSLRGFCR